MPAALHAVMHTRRAPHDPRATIAVCLALVGPAYAGCAAPPEISEGDLAGASEIGEGDVGDEDDAEARTFAIAASKACSRPKIMAAVSGARRDAITRGFTWLDANVPYSQSRSFKGYRTDCSGFVSMSWKLDRSYTTADFIGSSRKWKRLGGYGDLMPGDAIVRRSGGAGHVVLFLGWSDASQSSACVLEQASTASDMQFRARSASSLRSSGFKPIRSTSLPEAPAEDAAEDTAAEAPADDESEL